MEESVSKTAKSIMSLYANKPLHLPTTQVSPEELKDAFDNYELSLDMIWNIQPVKGLRRADVFAEMSQSLLQLSSFVDLQMASFLTQERALKFAMNHLLSLAPYRR